METIGIGLSVLNAIIEDVSFAWLESMGFRFFYVGVV
jgi:hypothetical protein